MMAALPAPISQLTTAVGTVEYGLVERFGEAPSREKFNGLRQSELALIAESPVQNITLRCLHGATLNTCLVRC